MIILFSFVFLFIFLYFFLRTKESFENKYFQKFLEKENRMFPFRYFVDENNQVLPFVAVTGPFRCDIAKHKYYEYIDNGIHVFGITAYKTFPNTKLFGKEEGKYEREDTFNYTKEIKNWLCCFKDRQKYGFTKWNNTIDISESDFYDSENGEYKMKKYDFIYICNKDHDTCPKTGWNAINRNYDLALKCFPLMCNKLNWNGLIVGRVGCDLEKLYGDKLEVVDFLEYSVLQDKMRQSKYLFVPNIFDASPRVIVECITKDIPVLMNRNILCGSKYINSQTGEFFSNENDLHIAIQNIQKRYYNISPRKWWKKNYSKDIRQKMLRDFLDEHFTGVLDNTTHVKFIL